MSAEPSDTTSPPHVVSPPAERLSAPPPPTIHEAERASGPSGRVDCGRELTFAEAVAHRRAEADVVVCGDDGKANKRLAGRIEAAVGPSTRPQPPERKAGPLALPHFHQASRDPDGHTFYETENRKARKKK